MKSFFTLLIFSVTILTHAQSKFNLDTSTVTWIGEKITSQSHTGTLKFKKAAINLEDLKNPYGVFEVDMTSLTNTDLTGKGKQQLEGHLKSADFFDVNTHATAYVSINKVLTKKGNLYEVSGDLTIKEITHPVNFSVTILKDKISGKLTFDRTKYNVKFASGSFFENLGDNLINDTITLEINLNKL